MENERDQQMRTEQEMFALIINTALDEERIKAVYMNGSRTNINVPKDIFQDYDIVYVVTETLPFIRNKKWLDRFGERLFMQCPDEMDAMRGMKTDVENTYGWLMQFADGNRIDLHVETVEHMKNNILSDKLCKVLLDKYGILPVIPEASDADYYVKKPTYPDYFCCCNEFYWCLDNVAKGLWREEIPYVQDMLNFCVRPQLVQMLSWKIGVVTGFSCSIGKSGKYMYRWLSEIEWETFLLTYASGSLSSHWESVWKMCELFETAAVEVGSLLNYKYNKTEADNCLRFLKHVKNLPKDAAEIY